MCDCLPENFRSNFRCRKKNRIFFFDIGNLDLFGIAFELTVIHIWVYMVILGILIAFTIKTFGYCCTQKNSKVLKTIEIKRNAGGVTFPAVDESSAEGLVEEDRDSFMNLSSDSDLGPGCNCKNKC